MGGRSVILDQGRQKRLFDQPQRAALRLLYPECTAVDCSIPAAWCEAHHKVHWCQGGKTSVEDGTLLCPFHHHRAHDPGWLTSHHPNGDDHVHQTPIGAHPDEKSSATPSVILVTPYWTSRQNGCPAGSANT